MLKVLITFNLKDAKGDDYERGYKTLALHGFSRLTGEKHKLRLPHGSVLGDTNLGKTAKDIRDAATCLLANTTGCRVERMFVAVVTDWSCSGDQDEKLWLQEVATRVQQRLGR